MESIQFAASQCGRDFDEYVARTLGSWEPSSRPETRTLTNLWQGRRCKICLPGQGWHQGKVCTWTQSVDSPETCSKWSLELEIIQDAADNSAGGSEGGTTREEEETQAVMMTFLVNRMNIDGGGTLKSDSDQSSTDLISLEWMQPAEPVLDLNEGVLSYRCPYCRAIEPVVAAYEDPTLERNDECPVCLETCACRVLQCGHCICYSCWDSCRRSAIVSSIEVDELDVEQIEKDRAEHDMVDFAEALSECLAAFTEIADEASIGKEGLTRFHRELMVESPEVWLHPKLYPIYEEMPVEYLKILLQVLEDRKVETFGLFHTMSARTADWIAFSYAVTDLPRLAIPWLQLRYYHVKKRGFRSDTQACIGELMSVLGVLHYTFDQLTKSLRSFEECLSSGSDDEEVSKRREDVLREMKEWTGTSGKLTPRC